MLVGAQRRPCMLVGVRVGSETALYVSCESGLRDGPVC